MNLNELQSERAKIAQEIEDKTRELLADLAAVDRLIARCGAETNESKAAVAEPQMRARSKSDALVRVNLADLVRKAIDAFAGEAFSKNTIVEWLAKNHPLVAPNHATISAQLWHMQQKGMLETVQERNGNKPALYKATATFSLAA